MSLINLQPGRRLLRLALGLMLLWIGWSVDPDAWSGAILLRLIALYPLFTAIVGWSPIQSLLTPTSTPPADTERDDHG